MTFTAAQPTAHESSPGVRRGFCARCGSTVSYQGANLPDMIHLHIGLFDDADRLLPTREESVAARLCRINPLIARS